MINDLPTSESPLAIALSIVSPRPKPRPRPRPRPVSMPKSPEYESFHLTSTDADWHICMKTNNYNWCFKSVSLRESSTQELRSKRAALCSPVTTINRNAQRGCNWRVLIWHERWGVPLQVKHKPRTIGITCFCCRKLVTYLAVFIILAQSDFESLQSGE